MAQAPTPEALRGWLEETARIASEGGFGQDLLVAEALLALLAASEAAGQPSAQVEAADALESLWGRLADDPAHEADFIAVSRAMHVLRRAQGVSREMRPFRDPDDEPSEAPAAPTRGTWRTIETAPKDGTPVLGFERSERGPQVMRYSGVCWSSVPGGYSCHPTHWMALPSPPAPEKEL